MWRRVQQVHEDRQGGRCHHRTERRIAPKCHHDDPKHDCRRYRLPANGEKHSQARRDTFSALEPEPHGKHVANHGEQGGGHHPDNFAVCHAARQVHRGIALTGIEKQCENPRHGPCVARDVRRPDITAACLANVRPARLDDQESEGN